MKKIIIYTVSALIFLTILTLVSGYFPFMNTKPDVVLILVIFVAIESDNTSDMLIAFIAGYLQDVFSGNTVGLFAMLRTVTFVISRFLNLNLFAKNRFFFVVTTFIVSIFDSMFLGYQFKSNGNGFFSILLFSLYFSLINSLLAFIIYPLLSRIEGIYLKTLKQQEGRY